MIDICKLPEVLKFLIKNEDLRLPGSDESKYNLIYLCKNNLYLFSINTMFFSLLEYLYGCVINYDDVIRELDKTEIYLFLEQYISSIVHQM